MTPLIRFNFRSSPILPIFFDDFEYFVHFSSRSKCARSGRQKALHVSLWNDEYLWIHKRFESIEDLTKKIDIDRPLISAVCIFNKNPLKPFSIAINRFTHGI